MEFIETIKDIQFLRGMFIRLRGMLYSLIPVIGGGNRIKRNGVVISSKIRVRGSNNQIELQKGSVLINAKVEIHGNNHHVLIASGAYLEGTHIVVEDNHCVLSIGKNTFIGPSHLAVTEDECQLVIGNECMISSHVQVRTGDSHAIFDFNGQRINAAANVRIGNMVWLGEGCKVLKGVTLKDDTIVSTGSIVTKSFEGNVLIGGVPAKILKEGVSWSHSRK